MYKCFFYSQSKHLLSAVCFSHLLNSAETYCWIFLLLIFISFFMKMRFFEKQTIWAVEFMNWEIEFLQDQMMLAKHMSSLICWHNMMNSDRVFRKSQFMSWIQTSFNIFHLKASIFAVSFHSSSLTRSKNSEKKLVNSQFHYQNSSSFVAALCLQLTSLYVHFRSEMNRSRIQNMSFQKNEFIVWTALFFKQDMT